MIREWQLQNYNRPIDSLLRLDLVLDPAYQRESVWTIEQRRNLVLSVVQGLPIGALFLNNRDWQTTVVVDGKQRIETLRLFMDDEFSVPREWLPDTEVTAPTGRDWVFYSETSAKFQRGFRNFAVATYETHFRGKDAEAAERELFDRINYGGTPHPPKVAA